MKNLIRTNTNEFRKRAFNYLVDCLRNEDNENEDAETIVRDFLANYENAGNYPNNKKRIPNNQKRLSDYLSGLPTSLPFNWGDIMEDAKMLHQCEKLTDKEEERIFKNHWNFWAFQIMKMEELTINRKLNKFLAK